MTKKEIDRQVRKSQKEFEKRLKPLEKRLKTLEKQSLKISIPILTEIFK